MIAGAVGGFFSLFAYVPTDLLKTRGQMSTDKVLPLRQEAANIIKEKGIMGMYKSYWAFFWRDVPGTALLFWATVVFDGISRHPNPFLSWLFLANASGLAGIVMWIFSIPQDIVKTYIQMQKHDISMWQAIKELRAQGKSFYAGGIPLLMRAYVIYFITLPLYGGIMKLLA